MTENKNSIEFLDETGAVNEAEKMKKLMDALMFGVPTLGQKLSNIFEDNGLDGLRAIEHTLDKYVMVSMIINDVDDSIQHITLIASNNRSHSEVDLDLNVIYDSDNKDSIEAHRD